MSYDPKCDELARYFLPKQASESLVAILAQIVQDEVEDFLTYDTRTSALRAELRSEGEEEKRLKGNVAQSLADGALILIIDEIEREGDVRRELHTRFPDCRIESISKLRSVIDPYLVGWQVIVHGVSKQRLQDAFDHPKQEKP